MKRVMLVDGHDIVRTGLRAMLEARPRLEVVGEASTGQEALDQARETDPHIAIIGSRLPDTEGDELVRRLRAAVPSVKIMACVLQDRDRAILDLIEAGALAVVLKSDCSDEVLTALDCITVGRRYHSPRVRELLELASNRRLKTGSPTMSPREQQVVQLIAEGKTNKQIGFMLEVSIKTVEAHRTKVMNKLSLRNTAELVRYALRNELVAA